MLGWPIVEFVFSTSSRSGRRSAGKMTAGGPQGWRAAPPRPAAGPRAAGVERHDAKIVGVRDGKPLLADGTVLDVANVIWATGYRPDYALDRRGGSSAPDGWPEEVRGVSPTVPGLYFLGVPFQYAFTSMLIGGAGRDAKYVVDRIAERVAASSSQRAAAPAAA